MGKLSGRDEDKRRSFPSSEVRTHNEGRTLGGGGGLFDSIYVNVICMKVFVICEERKGRHPMGDTQYIWTR